MLIVMILYGLVHTMLWLYFRVGISSKNLSDSFWVIWSTKATPQIRGSGDSLVTEGSHHTLASRATSHSSSRATTEDWGQWGLWSRNGFRWSTIFSDDDYRAVRAFFGNFSSTRVFSDFWETFDVRNLLVTLGSPLSNLSQIALPLCLIELSFVKLLSL